MSRSQLSRTPANFPRMKHRAAGRLARKRGHNKMTPGRAVDVFAAIGKAFTDAIDSLAYAFTGFARAFRPEPTQADFMLSGPVIEPPMLMATRPQDWSPASRALIWPERRNW